MENTFYLAVYGKQQIPFKDLDSLVAYFQNSGDLFKSFLDDVKCYKMTLEKIDSPLKND